MYVSIGQAAILIGVAVSTLRRWEADDKFRSAFRTKGGHRRYSLQEIEQHFYPTQMAGKISNRKIILYSRVSSHDPKNDLIRQTERLQEYAKSQGFQNIQTISDLGSGISAPSKAWHFQKVKVLPMQVVEPPHVESSLGFMRAIA